MKRRKFKCVYATYTPKEIFALHIPGKLLHLPLPNGKVVKCSYSQLRLNCFKKSLVCAACKRVGHIFVLEHLRSDNSLNLRLYNEEGGLHTFNGGLMTVDHIFPKSLGGSNKQHNLQTMCASCNCKKGSQLNWALPAHQIKNSA